MKFTKLDYRQYLLSSPINYTVTNLANSIERYFDAKGFDFADTVGECATNRITLSITNRRVKIFRGCSTITGLTIRH